MAALEITYTAKQAAESVGLSPAQLRRYAQAYVEVSGERITKLPREGRRYTGAQLDAIRRAKAFVGDNPTMTVEAALRLILHGSEPSGEQPPPATVQESTDLEVFAQSLVQPLVREMREGQEELAQSLTRSFLQALETMRQEDRERIRQLEERLTRLETPQHSAEDSALVRLIKRLERLLGW